MSHLSLPLPTIGIIGGGQLGRMFLQNAANYGVNVVVLENEADAPAAQLTQHFIKGHIQDPQAIRLLAEQSDVLTYEIEHVNVEVLLTLKSEGYLIIPDPEILQLIQDKGLQKAFYQKNNLPTAPFLCVESAEEWLPAMQQLGGGRFAAKSRKGGYDGKGVFLTDVHWVEQHPEDIPFDGPTVIEQFISCEKEIAVLVAVSRDHEMAVYPAVEMEFHPISNLVTYLFTPANITTAVETKAKELALKTVNALGGAGLFAVEMFMDDRGDLFVNEIAPRPHNSAHHTIEGAYTSQFDQLFRILTGLPLGSTDFRQPAVMINLVGPEGGSGQYYLQGITEALAKEGVYIHMYGKKHSKPHRKLGHITIVADTIDAAKSKAHLIRELVSIQLL